MLLSNIYTSRRRFMMFAANGRTVRSLAYVLSMYSGVKMYFVAPDVVRMKDDVKQYLSSVGVDWEEVDDLKVRKIMRMQWIAKQQGFNPKPGTLIYNIGVGYRVASLWFPSREQQQQQQLSVLTLVPHPFFLILCRLWRQT